MREKRPQPGQQVGGFQNWSRRIGGRFFLAEDTVAAGEYSDDTQLLLATARALVSAGRDWFPWFVRGELPTWMLYERGGGRATKAAAAAWSARREPWSLRTRREYFLAGGNGAAMRILPHVFAAHSEAELRRDILSNAAATHGHPRALIGALLYGLTAFAARGKTGRWELGELLECSARTRDYWAPPPGRDEMPPGWLSAADEATQGYGAIWAAAVDETVNTLDVVAEGIHEGVLLVDEDLLEKIGARKSKHSGAGDTTAAAAIFLAARYAADPATGLRVAAYGEHMDTDTVASMVGGLLGLMFGEEWLHPLWRDVQDAELLQRIGGRLECEVDQSRLRIEGWSETAQWSEKHSKELVAEIAGGTVAVGLGPLGAARVLRRDRLSAIARNTESTRWQLCTEDGQIVYVTKAERIVHSLVSDDPGPRAEEPLRPVSRAKGEGVVQPSPRSRLVAEIEALASRVPPTFTATELLLLVRDLVEANDELRRMAADDGSFLRANAASAIGRVLAGRGHVPIPDEVLLLAARLAWRLSKVTRGSS